MKIYWPVKMYTVYRVHRRIINCGLMLGVPPISNRIAPGSEQ